MSDYRCTCGQVYTDPDQITLCEIREHKLSYMKLEEELALLRHKNVKLYKELDELRENPCDDCLQYEDDGTPYTAYGWNENAVEGQIPCGCISESGPYQVLEEKYEQLQAEHEALTRFTQNSWEIASECVQLRGALRHITHNARASGCEMGMALDVAEKALFTSTPQTAKIQAVLTAAEEWFEHWDGPDQYSEVNGEQRLHDAVREYKE